MKKIFLTALLVASLPVFADSNIANDAFAFNNLKNCEKSLNFKNKADVTTLWKWQNRSNGGACGLSIKAPGLETSIEVYKKRIKANEAVIKNYTLNAQKANDDKTRNFALSVVANVTIENETLNSELNYRQSIYNQYIGYVNKKF